MSTAKNNTKKGVKNNPAPGAANLPEGKEGDNKQPGNDGVDGPSPNDGVDNEPEEVDPALLELVAIYKKAYPNAAAFHVTSDGQVFLDGNKRDGHAHAKTLGSELKTVAVN